MSRKKLNKVLIVVMVLIYGAVVFKYFIPDANAEKILSTEPENVFPTKISDPKEEFQLIVAERDPFLDKSIKSSRRKEVTKKIPISSNPNGYSKKMMVWPEIAYYGFIRAKQYEKSRAILKIEGVRYNIRLGESVKSVKIHKIYSDSIKVSLHGEIKVIKKYSSNGNNSRQLRQNVPLES